MSKKRIISRQLITILGIYFILLAFLIPLSLNMTPINDFTSENQINEISDWSGNPECLDGGCAPFSSGTGGEDTGFDGLYNASYSFTFDTDGSDPQGWTLDESGGDVSVVKLVNGHSKVMRLNDPSSGSDIGAGLSFSSQTTGTVEFYWMLKSGATTVTINDGINPPNIHLEWGGLGFPFRSHSGSAYQDTNVTVKDYERWYHHKIMFDCATNSFDWYIDGGLAGNDLDFWHNAASLCEFYIETNIEQNHDVYLDAIGFAWLDNYTIGDNLEPEGTPYGTLQGNYSFTDDSIGNNPDGWAASEPSNTDIRVIDGVGNLGKVVELFDNGTGYSEIYQSISQTSGIVEFWVRFSINSGANYYITILDGSDTNSIYFTIKNDGIIYYVDDGGENLIQDYEASTWYHFKIKFDCSASGDGTNDWHLWINGIEKSPSGGYSFRGSPTTMDEIEFKTQAIPKAYSMYIDAIGYSWTDYEIGDNLNYTDDALAGWYNASYSFQDNTIGSDPNFWTISESNGDIQVIEQYDGYNKVVELYHSGLSWVDMKKTFTARSNGTIELWVRASQTDSEIHINLRSAVVDGIEFYVDDTGYFTHGQTHIPIGPYLANQWYHIKIEFDCNDNWHLWINNISMDGGSGYNFRNSPSIIDYLSIMAQNASAPECLAHVDAIGFSWLDNYSIGDNYYETIRFPDSQPINWNWNWNPNWNLNLNINFNFPEPDIPAEELPIALFIIIFIVLISVLIIGGTTIVIQRAKKAEALVFLKKRKRFLEKATREGEDIRELADNGGDIASPKSIKPLKAKDPKVQKKKVKVHSTAETALALKTIEATLEEKKELEQTESELDIEKQKLICIVHKGQIVGPMYACPKCETLYCMRCANALKKKGDKCWSCGQDFKL